MGGDRHRSYAVAALRAQCDKVSATGKGSRDADLNAAALSLGHLLPNYPLSESEITEALLDAIFPHLDGEQGEQWARRKIAHGLRDGAKNPTTPREANYRPPRHLAGETPRPRTPIPGPPPKYPPLDTVEALWGEALPVDTSADLSTWDHDPAAWLQSRAIDVDAVAAHDLARMIPDGLELPPWAAIGRRDWRMAGYRLVVPMYDAAGDLRSVHARHTRPGEAPRFKSTNPTGHQVKSLLTANPHALELLRGTGEPSTVVISEGEPDYLTAATTWSTLPVFGIVAGSWTPEHAQRIPDGSTVVIRTDNDTKGDEYAEAIRNTFAGRQIELKRKRSRA